MKKIKFIALMLTLGIVIGLFAACSGGGSIGAKTIDVKDYITINYGKYNGKSEPTFDVDYYGMSAAFDVKKLNKYIETLPKMVQFEFSTINSYAHFFNFDFREDYENISNGDTIIIDVTFDSYLPDYGISMEDFCKHSGIKLNETTLEYTVSGLEELPDKIDLFEGIEQYAQYDGANGYGSLTGISLPDDYMRQVGELYLVKANDDNSTVEILLNNTKIAQISYSVDYNDQLSMGDTVTLKADVKAFGDTVVENDIVFLGTYCCFKSNALELTVPDLGKYLTTAEEFTSDVVEKIKAQIYEKYGVKSIEKMYFGTFLPGAKIPYYYKVPVFVTVIVTDKRDVYPDDDYYYMDYVENLILTQQGEVEFGYDEVTYWHYNELQEAVEDLDYDIATYTEIPLY